jgi:RNA polymerase sigma factor (sigma-70 family)
MRLAAKLWDSYVLQLRLSYQALATQRLSDAGRRGAWRRWQRERVILDSQPMVERIARDVRWMFARHLDIRDLVQAGNIGLLKAAQSYDPAKGEFEPYAYFRVRGAIIDSQKRRAYREESNVSLQAIADSRDGWLPPRLDTDRRPLQDELVARQQITARLARAIRDLPAMERTVIMGQLHGQSLSVTAKQVGRSLTWTRAKLAEARELVAIAVRGE